jgi:hypothetical protein
VDQPDLDAWLQALAARVDDGEAIDWAAAEERAGPEGRHVVRGLRIVARIADEARRPMETVQSAPVTERQIQPVPQPVSRPADEPGRTPPVTRTDDEPYSDRYRSFTPSEPAEIRRKLLFGVTLLLALASVYAGLLGWGRVPQYGLAGLAVLTALIALISGATGPPRPPGAPDGPTPDAGSGPPPGPGPGPTA